MILSVVTYYDKYRNLYRHSDSTNQLIELIPGSVSDSIKNAGTYDSYSCTMNDNNIDYIIFVGGDAHHNIQAGLACLNSSSDVKFRAPIVGGRSYQLL